MARASVRKKPVAQMSYNVIMQLLRRVAELENERLRDPEYRSLRGELAAVNAKLFAVQQGAERHARQQESALKALQCASAVNLYDAECAYAELRAVRAALMEASSAVFRVSAEALHALREAAVDEVRVELETLRELVDELDQAGQDMAGEISRLREKLAEEQQWGAHEALERRTRIADLEGRFFAPARSALLNGSLPPWEQPPLTFYLRSTGEGTYEAYLAFDESSRV